MPTPPFEDAVKAHRWFAVESNNSAWPLIEAATRTPEETDQMLHLAHAAAWHWSVAGAAINQLRADQLLAQAYAVAEHGRLARHFAERARALIEKEIEGLTPFDRAVTAVVMCRALECDGQTIEGASWRAKAIEEAQRLTEEEDRQVLVRLLGSP
jgi:hypothetical protein